MKKIFCFLCFLFIAYGYACMSNQKLIGQWKVTQWLRAMPVGELGPEDIQNIIRKTLLINADTISLQVSVLQAEDRTCSISASTSGWINSDPIQYFNDHYAFFDADDYKAIGLQVPFWNLDSPCLSVFTTKDPNKIIFVFGENFFAAERISKT